MFLDPGRLKGLIDEALHADRFIICHATLPYATSDPTVKPAVCRGFHDRYSTRALRLITMMFGFTEIDPPGSDLHIPHMPSDAVDGTGRDLSDPDGGIPPQ